MSPFVSVIIPTYMRKDSLIRTLSALDSQTIAPGEFEVVVVSDGSPDDTVKEITGLSYGFQMVVLEQPNSGPSVARNYGASSARGDVLLFLDDDLEPAACFIETHARHHRASGNLVVIGPQSMPPGERFPLWIEWEGRMLENQYLRFRSGEWKAGPNNLYSGNFSLKRDIFLQSGGFDPAFKRQEDVELGFRLAALGMDFTFDPKADAHHRPVRTLESWYTTPYLYGVRDVQMARDKGETRSMELAREHYTGRNILTRAAARLVVGRGAVERALFAAMKPTIALLDRVAPRKAGLAFCSLAFNLRYLQGMAAELGGGRHLWADLQRRGAATGQK